MLCRESWSPNGSCAQLTFSLEVIFRDLFFKVLKALTSIKFNQHLLSLLQPVEGHIQPPLAFLAIYIYVDQVAGETRSRSS